VIPFSKIKMGIASILVREGYLAKVEEKQDRHPYLVVTLKYANGESAITHIKRVSTPGHRTYIKKEKIARILNGFGIAILSTPQGLLTDKEARKAKIGGELICEVY
jgi:small subunit ribosomal protein S8